MGNVLVGADVGTSGTKPTFTRNMISIVHTVNSRNMYTTCAAKEVSIFCQ